MLPRSKKAVTSPTAAQTEKIITLPSPKASKNPVQIYKELCTKTSKPPSAQIMSSMSEQDFALKVELLTLQEVSVLKLLLQNYSFKRILLYGEGEETIEQPEDKMAKTPSSSRGFNNKKQGNGNKTAKPAKQTNDKKKSKALQDTALVEAFCKGLGSVLGKDKVLERLQINGVHLSKDSVVALGNGLKENRNLKELIVNHCYLTSAAFEPLSLGIVENNQLNMIDFSHNKLDDACGRMIASIISSHAQKRDEFVWVYSIRGDKPEEDIELQGICDINLAYNQLESGAMKKISSALKYDTWLRNLNLRGNKIDDSALQLLIEVIRDNTSLFSLDLRENPFSDAKASKFILLKLSENMREYKRKNLLQNPPSQPVTTGRNNSDDNQFHPQFHPQMKNKLEIGVSGDEIKPVEETYTDDDIVDIPEGRIPFYPLDQKIEQDMDHINSDEDMDELIKKYNSMSPIEEEDIGQDGNVHSLSFGFRNNQIKEKLMNMNGLKPTVMRSDTHLNRKGSHPKKHNKKSKRDDKDIYEYCRNLEKKLLIAESKVVNLLLENYKLKKALNSAIQANSISAITPNPNDENLPSNVPESISQDLFRRAPGDLPPPEGDEMLGKIEYLMGELTRMMDNLENNNVTNNFTGNFTNSTTQTNNNTYQLINSANNIKFDNTNILNSQNNSRVQPSMLHQASTQNPIKEENSKSFSRISSSKGHGNSGENMDFSPRDKSDHHESKHYSLFFKNENSHHND